MQTILAWIVLVAQAVVSWGIAVEQYIEHEIRPAIEQRLPDVLSPLSDKIASTTVTSSTTQGIIAMTRQSTSALKTSSASVSSNTASTRDKQSAQRSSIATTPATSVQSRIEITPTVTKGMASGDVFMFTNVERYNTGAVLLVYDTQLEVMAKKKAHDMIENNYFAHESPTGVTIGDLAKIAGYEYISIGENLAFGNFKNANDVITAWMNSPGHRKNILSTTFTHIGIAVEKGMIDGGEGFVIVQEFGLPKSACPSADVELDTSLTELKHRIDVLDRTLAEVKQRIKETVHSDPSYNDLVDAYNATIRERNTLAVRYSEGAKLYNQQVADFNVCLEEKVHE